MSSNGAGMRIMYMVWGWLVAMTIVEVVLAYFQVPILIMLVVLIALSALKSVLIVAYFMHMKFERISLFLTLIPAAIACILLFNVFFPDSVRVRSEGVFRDIPPPQPVVEHTAEPGH